MSSNPPATNPDAARAGYPAGYPPGYPPQGAYPAGAYGAPAGYAPAVGQPVLGVPVNMMNSPMLAPMAMDPTSGGVACARCRVPMIVDQRMSMVGWCSVAALICLFWPLAWVPCCCGPPCREHVGICPSCGSRVELPAPHF